MERAACARGFDLVVHQTTRSLLAECVGCPRCCCFCLSPPSTALGSTDSISGGGVRCWGQSRRYSTGLRRGGVAQDARLELSVSCDIHAASRRRKVSIYNSSRYLNKQLANTEYALCVIQQCLSFLPTFAVRRCRKLSDFGELGGCDRQIDTKIMLQMILSETQIPNRSWYG